jgi:restriction endonuclease Mrr
MTNRNIVNYFNAKDKLKDKKLPIKLAFALKLNYEKLQPYANAYNEQLTEVEEKYELKKQKNPEENQNNFLKEVTELLDTEINCDIHKVDFKILERCEHAQFDKLTVGELEAIDFMIG